MQIEQKQWLPTAGWVPATNAKCLDAQLVFVFASTALLKLQDRMNEVKKYYPALS